MKFKNPLKPAILKKRYKRFLADVKLENGKIITVHCPNPGAMTGLIEKEYKCWISKSENKKRKLQYTLEIIEVQKNKNTVPVGINTNLPNKLAYEAIQKEKIKILNGYETIKKEVKYGDSSRVDMVLEKIGKPPCYVEVKNVHLVREKNIHEFPDCKTIRGTKHLRELTKMVEKGYRAVMLYIVQRQDGNVFRLAKDIDPDYYKEFKIAKKAGVEACAIRCKVSVTEIVAQDIIPIENV